MPRILVIDDDPTVRGVVLDYLRASGMEATASGDGLDGLAAARQGCDLIVLDLMLPRIEGLEVIRRLRAEGNDVPVVMLTARDGESDRILGLELGADDYLTKPFSPRELVLRVQAILRRGGAAGEETEHLVDGDISLDLRARKAEQGGAELPLATREFDLLAFLMANPNQVFSRERLMAEVWGWRHGDQSTVTVHVRRLRGKIETNPGEPSRLVTVWGRGYRWEPAS